MVVSEPSTVCKPLYALYVRFLNSTPNIVPKNVGSTHILYPTTPQRRPTRRELLAFGVGRTTRIRWGGDDIVVRPKGWGYSVNHGLVGPYLDYEFR